MSRALEKRTRPRNLRRFRGRRVVDCGLADSLHQVLHSQVRDVILDREGTASATCRCLLCLIAGVFLTQRLAGLLVFASIFLLNHVVRDPVLQAAVALVTSLAERIRPKEGQRHRQLRPRRAWAQADCLA